MLEILLLTTLSGVFVARRRNAGILNPFQIYFSIWSIIFFGYYIFKDEFIDLSHNFIFILFLVKLFAITLFLVSSRKIKLAPVKGVDGFGHVNNSSFISIAQWVVFLLIPVAYAKAMELSGGVDIFSVFGYIQLRRSFTDDGLSLGLSGYLTILSCVISSIYVALYCKKQVGFFRMFSSISISIFYIYLNTGRTSILLFFILILFPLAFLQIIKIRAIIFAFLVMILLFVFIAGMTTKGVSFEADFFENFKSFIDNIKGYTISPLLAFNEFMNTNYAVEFGSNSVRFFTAFWYALGVGNNPPISLIREFVYVPGPTNVYTVYEVYVRDFYYFGFLVPALFLLMHLWLYREANQKGSIWIFYYASSLYPLTMQFFQDQYFSLLSTWIQIGFWYWFFIVFGGINFKKFILMKHD